MMNKFEQFETLQKKINELESTLKVFFKVIVVNGKQYKPGFELCGGCEMLTAARGFECYFERTTTNCKYPDKLGER